MPSEAIQISDYNYPLPDERIAWQPLAQREQSKMLVYRNGEIEDAQFLSIGKYLPPNTLIVRNNTKVIKARLIFHKTTGARIEIFCLEPAHPDFAETFRSKGSSDWKCLIGNSKRWKEGELTSTQLVDNAEVTLTATKTADNTIRFTWNQPTLDWETVIGAFGKTPLPPYIHRESTDADTTRYQTVFAEHSGSVAAPTAGLHFTPEIIAQLQAAGIRFEDVMLHTGAGTFLPVKTDNIREHEMHREFISISRSTLEAILHNKGPILCVGTTSLRTIESAYWAGVKMIRKSFQAESGLLVDQWDPYNADYQNISVENSITALIEYLDNIRLESLSGFTRLMVIPGYDFKMTNILLTNFHQPASTLLLLISAFVEGNWKQIYNHALASDYRFLSYGDCCLVEGRSDV
ncbi:MAG: S-adenosylmethionine:tRNA ribosyltransferase-isomerase [Bacteroidetes bacterium]|nr:S-adenosylmethionine:tRNA ribosyltransferase-isomerase [Bacteroidota bacterium]MBU1719415.1 S-adenosylmethionine:tRNA ribosyltransferase-isomerase [Bacteroidota bacterium]